MQTNCMSRETAVIVATEVSPQTGDTRNMMLWISLLFISSTAYLKIRSFDLKLARFEI